MKSGKLQRLEQSAFREGRIPKGWERASQKRRLHKNRRGMEAWGWTDMWGLRSEKEDLQLRIQAP